MRYTVVIIAKYCFLILTCMEKNMKKCQNTVIHGKSEKKIKILIQIGKNLSGETCRLSRMFPR